MCLYRSVFENVPCKLLPIAYILQAAWVYICFMPLFGPFCLQRAGPLITPALGRGLLLRSEYFCRVLRRKGAILSSVYYSCTVFGPSANYLQLKITANHHPALSCLFEKEGLITTPPANSGLPLVFSDSNLGVTCNVEAKE